jgi:hypothetical protein
MKEALLLFITFNPLSEEYIHKEPKFIEFPLVCKKHTMKNNPNLLEDTEEKQKRQKIMIEKDVYICPGDYRERRHNTY